MTRGRGSVYDGARTFPNLGPQGAEKALRVRVEAGGRNMAADVGFGGEAGGCARSDEAKLDQQSLLDPVAFSG